MTVEEYAFTIISYVGMAKSKYLEAIELAKKGDMEACNASIEEGKNFYLEGHKAHAEILAKSAGADDIQMTLILAHAEDQLMSTETIEVMSKYIIELYSKVQG